MVRKSRMGVRSPAQLSVVGGQPGCRVYGKSPRWLPGPDLVPGEVGSLMAPWSGSGVTRSPSGEAATRVPVKRKVRWVQRGGSEAP